MVRITRFGWQDAGPLTGPWNDAGGTPDIDDDLTLEPRRTRRRRRLKKNSPVDRSPPNNTPPLPVEAERAA